MSEGVVSNNACLTAFFQFICLPIFTSLRKKCPNIEFFLSVFSRIQSKYGKIRNRKNSVFRLFLRSAHHDLNISPLVYSNLNSLQCYSMEPKTSVKMAKIRWNTHFKQCKNVKSKIFPLLLSYTSIKVGLQCHSRPSPPPSHLEVSRAPLACFQRTLYSVENNQFYYFFLFRKLLWCGILRNFR